MKKNLWNFFPRTISEKQASDTGMAAVLIFLLIGFFTGNTLYYKIAIPILIINMTYAMFFYPLAIVWLGLTQLLGAFVSKILLSLVFLLLVVPVGVFRRLLGKDSLQLNEFKKSRNSAMKTRNYSFTSKDIEKPY